MRGKFNLNENNKSQMSDKKRRREQRKLEIKLEKKETQKDMMRQKKEGTLTLPTDIETEN